MTEKDFDVVCSKIEDKSDFLNSVSQEIWKMPELQYKEVQAHAVDFFETLLHANSEQSTVQKRAEYCTKKGVGPTVAVLLEYDALPEIGHACGHNLIAEAGLGAALAIKAAMEGDADLHGKLVVLGTPAEEGGGGKIRLLELGAFDGIDVAMMVHPSPHSNIFPVTLCNVKYKIEFRGKEAHAGACPWEGRNALDAAVTCYQSIAQLRQHIKPSWRIQAIITKGGTVTNVIPSHTTMQVSLRTPTRGERSQLQTRVEACLTSAASATGCEVQFQYDEANSYENMVTNKTLGNLFKKYAHKLGQDPDLEEYKNFAFGSTDMGNVSHVLPSIHPFYPIPSEAVNHTTGFTDASGSAHAQGPTLLVSKSLAMTALEVYRSAQVLQDVKRDFENDMKDNL
ncbi:peptidase M20 domain-containing protein 2 [Caerostris extrusa]|uniref:Peptidase M20 domain-containing protein 2 n=1 Tax=Caerostris extrusa TaxID=172846 RepID=A0AAV4R1C9_CAEEX|nr:peptidase M20 domain-containing protein 2 [Caerostris extrusa]